MNSAQPAIWLPSASVVPSCARTVSAPPEAWETTCIGRQPVSSAGSKPIAVHVIVPSVTVAPIVVGQAGSVPPVVPPDDWKLKPLKPFGWLKDPDGRKTAPAA